MERYLTSQIRILTMVCFVFFYMILIKFVGVVSEEKSLKVFWQKNDKFVGFFG